MCGLTGFIDNDKNIFFSKDDIQKIARVYLLIFWNGSAGLCAFQARNPKPKVKKN